MFRDPARQIALKANRSLWSGLLLWCLGFGAATAAELQNIQVRNLPGEVVEVRLGLSEADIPVSHFAIDQPPRIVLDLPNTALALSKPRQNVGSHALTSLQAVEAGGRSRVILNLNRMVGYQVSGSGTETVIRLGRAGAMATADSASASDSTNRVENVDFRRGEEGEGRVIVSFADSNIATDIREEGGVLVVELPGSRLPESLERRLDVIDFATPVRTVDSFTRDGVARLVIGAAGDVEHLAYQSENRLIIDIKRPSQEERAAQEEMEYQGEKLTLNFQDIEVRAVLQIIADFTGMNIVASDSVSGNITLRLKDVPWDEALDIILKTKGLGMRQMGSIVMVAPNDEIAARDKAELEAQKQREQLSPLQNTSIQINYAKANDIATLLKSEQNSLMSSRGTVSIDERTNKLLIKETPENLREINRLVKELDVPVRQVLIESRIVIANDDFSRDIGARFGVSAGDASGATGVTTGTLDGTDSILGNGGSITTGSLPATNDRLNVNLPVQNPAGSLAISVLNGNVLLDMELTALQTEGRGEVISNPRVITSNQKEAEIEQGVEIPYLQATSSGATSVAFKKAVLSLQVTPQITPDNRIIMDLRVSKDSVGEVFNGVPSVNTREVNTQVLVDDGDTVVLGGIYEQTYSEEVDKVPLLGDLPLIGALFRSKRKVDDKAELLIFVTPKVLHDGLKPR
ncbi:MAG: type IV pilus secretin PilQ [Gammaproteobacteria bacterium]|nr:type IV pilus secretin PilQ [Gammaproteobacteria bacterium]